MPLFCMQAHEIELARRCARWAVIEENFAAVMLAGAHIIGYRVIGGSGDF